MALNLQHQTKAEFAARLRERFRNASREEACRLAYKLWTFIQDGDYTQQQVFNFFGLDTQAKQDAFVAKLTSYKDAYAVLVNAQGE